MGKNSFSIKLLNKSLIIFFKDALKVAIKNPSQAFIFFRTLMWLVKASMKRKKFKRQGIHIPPIIIFSITNRCNLQCNGCYSFIDALQSNFLKTIRENPELLKPTEGGCSLWKNREKVQSLLSKNEPFVKNISNKQ